jgi:hypothetical protein
MLSRQAAKLAKKDLLSISPNLGAFASLRETQFFLIFSLSQNFKYLWLDFSQRTDQAVLGLSAKKTSVYDS